jgi:hypothetical protein
MALKARRFLLAAAVIAAAVSQFSCSSETGPQPGTPAFLWSIAKESFSANDFAKTSQNLEKIAASENEYTARAQAWLLVLNSGLIRGNMDLADGLEAGVRAKKADPGGFRKYISNSRSSAGRLSLQFAESFMKFQKGKDDPVVLAFTLPSGSAAAVPEITKAMNGLPLQPPEIESAQRRALERAVLLETCRAAGAPDDTAKAADMFKAGEVKVPRTTFLAAMGNSLYEQAQLYSSTKLDDPNKVKMFSTLASDALKGVPETTQTKELSAKIQKAMLKK